MFESNQNCEISSNAVFTVSRMQEKRNNRHFTDDDERLICELANAGLMAYQIAVKFDSTAKRVKMVCERHGVDVISKDNQKNKRTKQILALLQNGYTTQQILNKVDCDRELIAQVRYRNGFSKSLSKAQERAGKAAKEAIVLVREGMTVREACKMVGISHMTYGKYKKAANGG